MKSGRSLRAIARFGSAERATASIEFTVIGPLLLVLLLGGFEGSRTVSMVRHLSEFTNSVAWDFAGTNDQSSGKTTAKGVRLYEMATRFGLIVPEMTNTALYDHVRYKIGFTMVQMTPTVANCATGCTYTANVAWTWGDLTRSCGTLASQNNGAAYDPAALPAGAFQPGAVAVVDVQAVYTPVLNIPLFPSRTFTFSAYYPVRNNTGGVYIPWDGANDFWTGAKCSGFP